MNLLAQDLAYTFDPVLFARAVGIEPDPWQARVLRSPSKRMLLNCTRQAGKSTVASVKAVHQAVFYPKSLVVLVSPSQRQSGELFRKVTDLFKAAPEAWRPKPNEDSKTMLSLENGSRIASLPGSEATIRGFSGASLIIEDEASRVDDDLYRAVRPMLAVSKGSLILMSTPFGKRGHFWQEWDTGQNWERTRIPASECSRISPEFLAEERRSLGEWWFAQEYCCEFGEAVDSFFREQDIRNALVDDVPTLDDERAGLDDGVQPLEVA